MLSKFHLFCRLFKLYWKFLRILDQQKKIKEQIYSYISKTFYYTAEFNFNSTVYNLLFLSKIG